MRMAITISPTRVLRLLLVLAFALPLAVAFRLEMGMLLVASRLMMRLTATVRAGAFELGLGLGNPCSGLCYNIPTRYFLFPFLFLNERNLCTIRSRGDSTSLLYVRLIVTHLES